MLRTQKQNCFVVDSCRLLCALKENPIKLLHSAYLQVWLFHSWTPDRERENVVNERTLSAFDSLLKSSTVRTALVASAARSSITE